MIIWSPFFFILTKFECFRNNSVSLKTIHCSFPLIFFNHLLREKFCFTFLKKFSLSSKNGKLKFEKKDTKFWFSIDKSPIQHVEHVLKNFDTMMRLYKFDQNLDMKFMFCLKRKWQMVSFVCIENFCKNRFLIENDEMRFLKWFL